MQQCGNCGADMPRPKGRSITYWTTRKFCDNACAAAHKNSLGRLLGFVEKTAGCWEWTGNKDKNGYGYFVRHGEAFRAHRFFYAHYKGPLHPDLFVLHSCDNPSCVNPDHLRLGTAADNTSDMLARGRQCNRRGVLNTQAKLDDEAVRSIRSDRRRSDDIAADFGVSPSAIRFIKSRQRWSHVR